MERSCKGHVKNNLMRIYLFRSNQFLKFIVKNILKNILKKIHSKNPLYITCFINFHDLPNYALFS